MKICMGCKQMVEDEDANLLCKKCLKELNRKTIKTKLGLTLREMLDLL